MYWPNRIKLTEYVFIYNYSTYYMCTINVNKITKRITMRVYYLIKLHNKDPTGHIIKYIFLYL